MRDAREISLNGTNQSKTPLWISFGTYRCWHGNIVLNNRENNGNTITERKRKMQNKLRKNTPAICAPYQGIEIQRSDHLVCQAQNDSHNFVALALKWRRLTQLSERRDLLR